MNTARFCQFSEPLPYPEAVLLQEELVKLRIEDAIPDTLLLLQHPAVITLGRRGRREHIQATDTLLNQAGLSVFTASRGGDVTAHAPGQWVLYPILKLTGNEKGAHGYLRALEQIALNTASDSGIAAFRREGMAGAWAAEGKFCAIGFKFTRWVSMHGLALNVNLDLRIFDLIVGCGLVGESVTSFEQILGEQSPDLETVGANLRTHSEAVLNRTLVECPEEELIPPNRS